MLSVVAIAKNEIKNVKGFVASWSEVADEIIILDTGSTDGTMTALRALEEENHKLRVFAGIWFGDFSQARNVAASHALGTNILWADLDDRVHQPSIPRIREMARARETAFAFQVASDVGNGNWHRFMQVRMYPNLPSMLFRGRIHENLTESLRVNEVEVIGDESVIVAHLGYADPVVKKQKAARNLEMLLRDGHPTTAEALAQVGDALYVMEKYRVGLGYYEEAVRKGGPDVEKALAEKLIVGYLHWGALDKAHGAISAHLTRFSVAYEYWMGEYWRLRGETLGMARLHYHRCLTGTRDLGSRECNGDAMMYEARQRLSEMDAALLKAVEVACAPA